MTDKVEVEEIVELTRKYLAPYQPEAYKLIVDPNSVQREDDWYYVDVSPDRKEVKSFDYNPRLAKAEQDIEDNTHRKILFVPVVPD